MAEKACSREALAAPPTIQRRTSFRKTLRESEGALPAEYLDALEQKRKQLDESIHKYIAAKEREYKSYEKELKQQARTAAGQASNTAHGSGMASGTGSSGVNKRRTSSESTQDTASGSPFLPGRDNAAVDVLLASRPKRELGAPAIQENMSEQRAQMAGLKDRRDSEQREKEFIGVFTPPYLPAIDDKGARGLQRTESAPPKIESPPDDRTLEATSLPRAESEPAMQAKARRPAHLHLSQRTSSSGSSADGRLVSAMKSPTQPAIRPKRKRVSLAVGDSVVAPSDNVPSALNNSTTPSHSRTRSPENDRDQAKPIVPTGLTTSFDFAKQPVTSISERVEQLMNGTDLPATPVNKEAPKSDRASSRGAPLSTTPPPASRLDPDGDLFDLEDELDVPNAMAKDEYEDVVEEELDAVPGIAGRVEHSIPQTQRAEVPMASPGLRQGERYDYDPEGGLVPEPADKAHEQPVWNEASDSAEHLEFGPGPADFSSSSSQQPTNPGFRRPSVVADPKFKGPDYTTQEARAVTEEIYGSSYSRPGKGSFTGGSLGESYMAKHAEEMMKLRLGKKEQEVR